MKNETAVSSDDNAMLLPPNAIHSKKCRYLIFVNFLAYKIPNIQNFYYFCKLKER